MSQCYLTKNGHTRSKVLILAHHRKQYQEERRGAIAHLGPGDAVEISLLSRARRGCNDGQLTQLIVVAVLSGSWRWRGFCCVFWIRVCGQSFLLFLLFELYLPWNCKITFYIWKKEIKKEKKKTRIEFPEDSAVPNGETIIFFFNSLLSLYTMTFVKH